ncbi:nucleobase:cation symporter-2 family protein [Arthrobacter sp. S41]|uniref:nucleobase:cation symporter-2 family protein n=2 Tax=Micrococcaceae TaxID=1268 RepID=UPI001035A177|nr:nucleobase:cation symporter-2 family protein [Arthrobacter sp. S41]TAP28387.1 purine permease [Arthrobacter sp. S41]
MSAASSQPVLSARPEDERLSPGRTVAYGFQHVLTMYGGIIAPPLVMGGAAGMDTAQMGVLVACCLFVGGLATILQTLGIPFFGAQLPLVQGTSFSGVATMIAIMNGGGGMPAVFGAVLAAGAIGIVIAPFFAKLLRFFPPVVTGVVITIIGVSLFPVTADWAMGGAAAGENYGSMKNIALAAITLVILLALSKSGVAALSRLSILLSIVLGTIVAVFMGMTDFSQVLTGDIFAVPTPFAFGAPVFEISAIISMMIVILVTYTETTADMLAVAEVTGSKVDARRIANGLRADMLSSTVAPVFNTFTQSAFAQNVGLVAITGVKSRFVVATGGGILVILGLLPVLGRVIASVPQPVLGGAGIVLFGSVAAAGIRTLAKVKDDNMNMLIIATSLAFGCIPMVKADFYAAFPTWVGTIFQSSISSATIMAVLLNIIFNELSWGKKTISQRAVYKYQIAGLEDGDRLIDGKLYDHQGLEVQIIAEQPGQAGDRPMPQG